MKRIEIANEEAIRCPQCGGNPLGDGGINTCSHTLFVATDEGLEFCSDKLDINELEQNALEVGWDEATDKIEYPGSVKYAVYQPAPSFFGAYFGYLE